MKLGLYCLVNERTHASVMVSASRSPAEMLTTFLPLLVPHALSVNSASVYRIGEFDDERFDVVPCTPVRIEWSSTDYETSLPDGILRSLKKTGALPSDAPVLDADVIDSRLLAIENRLKDI